MGWQVDTDFNVGYGFVGGEGAGWRVHAGFITRCRCVGGEGGGGVACQYWLHCRLRMVGSCWLHFRLKLCRTRGRWGGRWSWRVHATFTGG